MLIKEVSLNSNINYAISKSEAFLVLWTTDYYVGTLAIAGFSEGFVTVLALTTLGPRGPLSAPGPLNSWACWALSLPIPSPLRVVFKKKKKL